MHGQTVVIHHSRKASWHNIGPTVMICQRESEQNVGVSRSGWPRCQPPWMLSLATKYIMYGWTVVTRHSRRVSWSNLGQTVVRNRQRESEPKQSLIECWFEFHEASDPDVNPITITFNSEFYSWPNSHDPSQQEASQTSNLGPADVIRQQESKPKQSLIKYWSFTKQVTRMSTRILLF